MRFLYFIDIRVEEAIQLRALSYPVEELVSFRSQVES